MFLVIHISVHVKSHQKASALVKYFIPSDLPQMGLTGLNTGQKIWNGYGMEMKVRSSVMARESRNGTVTQCEVVLCLCKDCRNTHVNVGLLKILNTHITSNPVTIQVNKTIQEQSDPLIFQDVCSMSPCSTEPQKPSYHLGFPLIKSSTSLKLLKTIAL